MKQGCYNQKFPYGCIRVLENGAEILYYCDDRAVQNVSENDQLSDDVSYHQTTSCNSTSRKLDSCSVLGLLMCFENSHSLLPFIIHKGSYDRKHKICIFIMPISKEQMFSVHQQKFLSFYHLGMLLCSY